MQSGYVSNLGEGLDGNARWKGRCGEERRTGCEVVRNSRLEYRRQMVRKSPCLIPMQRDNTIPWAGTLFYVQVVQVVGPIRET